MRSGRSGWCFGKFFELFPAVVGVAHPCPAQIRSGKEILADFEKLVASTPEDPELGTGLWQPEYGRYGHCRSSSQLIFWLTSPTRLGSTHQLHVRVHAGPPLWWLHCRHPQGGGQHGTAPAPGCRCPRPRRDLLDNDDICQVCKGVTTVFDVRAHRHLSQTGLPRFYRAAL